jgi:hypothetical protein
LDFSAFNEHGHSASQLLGREEMNKLVLINNYFAPVKPQNPGVLFATQIFTFFSPNPRTRLSKQTPLPQRAKCLRRLNIEFAN